MGEVTASLQKNELRKAEITGYTTEGHGVARVGGFVLFVPAAARGDICLLRVTKVLKHHGFAIIEQLITPSPHRIEPRCPAFPKCGGCDFWHISYSEELRLKAQRIADDLTRIGGQNNLPAIAVTPSPSIEGCRNKAQFPLGRGANGTVFGFYRSHSHDIVPLAVCPVQDSRAVALAKAVCRWADETGTDTLETGGPLRHVYVRCSDSGALLCVTTGQKLRRTALLTEYARQACPDLSGVTQCVISGLTNRVLGEEYITLWGQPYIEQTVLGNTFHLSPQSFFQVNPYQTENLYNCALNMCGFNGGEVAVDLYCGIGTITQGMAKLCGSVIGVEIVPKAIEDARESAARNGVLNAEFICADASQAAEDLQKRGLLPDVILCDPPRKGLDARAISAITAMNPARIVYVSCDSASLARDCNALCAAGWHIADVRAFDMFPRTRHVETVVLLSHKSVNYKNY